MKKNLTPSMGLMLILLFFTSLVNAQNIGAIFSSTTAGTLDGIPFTISDWPSSGFTARLSTDSYTNTLSYCAPLTANEDNITHPSGLGWTVTFDQPVENLRVYFICFRSTSNGNFSEPGVMLSGQGGFAHNGTATTGSSCSAGLIEFPGPLTTLTFTPNTLGSGSFQNFTFGLGDGTDCGNAGGFADPCAITFNDPGNVILENGSVTGQGFATPSGGVYSGPGVTDNGNGFTFTFDPAVTGLGAQEVTYTLDDPGEWVIIDGSNQTGTANDGNSFGNRTAITPDGSRMIVSALVNNTGFTRAGKVEVYDWNGTSWTQVGQTFNGNRSNDFLGDGVAIASDGERIAIGVAESNFSAGRVEIYDWNSNTSMWDQIGFIEAESALGLASFGQALSFSADGNRLAVGGGGTGGNIARVFDWNGNAWVQAGPTLEGERKADNDRFGQFVGLSADGNILAVAATENNTGLANPKPGYVKVYQWDANQSDWIQLGNTVRGDVDRGSFGASLSLSDDGMRFLGTRTTNNDFRSRVFQYNSNNNMWEQMGSDITSVSTRSGDISPDGNRVAFESGASLSVFDWDGNEWIQVGITSNMGYSASSISLSNTDYILAGGSNNIGLFEFVAGCTASATADLLVISNNPATIDTESGNRLTFGDPCFCENPLNCLQDNGELLFHDVLRIPATGTLTTGLEIRIESSSNFFIDAPCNGGTLMEPSYGAISGTIIPETSPGVYEIDFWRPSGTQPALSVTESNVVTMAPMATFQPLCFQEDCPDCSITNLAVVTEDVCDGTDANFTLSFEVADGSGNYNLVAVGANTDLGITDGQVLGSITGGATDATTIEIMGAVSATTTTTSIMVQVVDADNNTCGTDPIAVSIAACVSSEPLPAMNRWGLILFSMIILGAGLLAYRRF